MPAKKSEQKAPAKVIDITSPGNSPPSTSSRPVIVSNRPILKDPMVVVAADQKSSAPELDSSKSSATAQGAPPLHDASQLSPSQSSKVISPLGSASKSPSKSPDDEVKPQIHDSIPETAAPTADQADSADTGSGSAESDNKNQAVAAVADSQSQAVPAADKTASEGDKTPAPEPPASEADQAADDDQNKQMTPSAEDQAAAAREAAQTEKINKLIEEKAYNLPINAVELRRSKRDVLLGALLIILLAVVWLDLAADVGLVKVPFLPVTHIFSKK